MWLVTLIGDPHDLYYDAPDIGQIVIHKKVDDVRSYLLHTIIPQLLQHSDNRWTEDSEIEAKSNLVYRMIRQGFQLNYLYQKYGFWDQKNKYYLDLKNNSNFSRASNQDKKDILNILNDISGTIEDYINYQSLESNHLPYGFDINGDDRFITIDSITLSDIDNLLLI